MTWFKCLCCKKGYNSDTLRECPKCHTPKGWQSPYVHKPYPPRVEELRRIIEKEKNPMERDKLILELLKEMQK